MLNWVVTNRLTTSIYAFNNLKGLPLEILLESVPERKTLGYNLSSADWAIKKFSFAYIGSVRELLASKKIDSQVTKTSGFWGVGDPYLEGTNFDGDDAKPYLLRGSIDENLSSIGSLPALPDTALELKSALKKFEGHGQILLGKEATEAAVRKANLGKYRYLAFATHGLVKQDVQGINEAALVLTPASYGYYKILRRIRC